MMLGIGLGIMAILCAVGLIGGGLFMHHEMKDRKDPPAIERGHEHGKAGEPSRESLLGEREEGTILWAPADKVAGEDGTTAAQQCTNCD